MGWTPPGSHKAEMARRAAELGLAEGVTTDEAIAKYQELMVRHNSTSQYFTLSKYDLFALFQNLAKTSCLRRHVKLAVAFKSNQMLLQYTGTEQFDIFTILPHYQIASISSPS